MKQSVALEGRFGFWRSGRVWVHHALGKGLMNGLEQGGTCTLASTHVLLHCRVLNSCPAGAVSPCLVGQTLGGVGGGAAGRRSSSRACLQPRGCVGAAVVRSGLLPVTLECCRGPQGAAGAGFAVEKIQAMFTVLGAFGSVTTGHSSSSTRFSMVLSLDFSATGRITAAHLQVPGRTGGLWLNPGLSSPWAREERCSASGPKVPQTAAEQELCQLRGRVPITSSPGRDCRTALE